MNIETENITKKYGDRTVLQNLNINIKKGQILALLGPNGAGKSTAIKILSGQVKPTSGKICIDSVE